MALEYLGNCAWEAVTEKQPFTPPGELPGFRERWIGRQDQLATFLAAKVVGSAYTTDAYILDNTPQDNTPFEGVATVDLIVATVPDFAAYWATDSESIKTASRSATVTSSSIIDGADEVNAERNVTFRSPQTRYLYFKATRPTAARFAAPLTSANPVMIKSVMKASAEVDGQSRERIFAGGTAPAPLVSALAMVVVNVGTNPDAEPIAGTPWFRCSEVWSRELEGD